MARVYVRNFRGVGKRGDLLASLDEGDEAFRASYAELTPTAANWYDMRPGASGGEPFFEWPTVRDLAAAAPHNGPYEGRGSALTDMDPEVVRRRMSAYFDPKVSDDALRAMHPSLVMTGNRIKGGETRTKILAARRFNAAFVAPFMLKPFDKRFAYLDNIRPLFMEPSPTLLALARVPGTAFFIARNDSDVPEEGYVTSFGPTVCDRDFLRGHAYFFPVVLPGNAVEDDASVQVGLSFDARGEDRPNLSDAARAHLAALGLPATPETSRLLWLHALATTHAPAYLRDHADGLRGGWPRVPLPADVAALRASAALGARLAALLDPDTPVPGVTTGALDPALATVAVPRTRPGAARDWSLTGWGTRTEAGVTMPGRGSTTARDYAAPAEAATAARADRLGARTLDVAMNGASLWSNIPEAVWETRIGGYQVIKKWLSYRDATILGRPLSEAEVTHVQATARRLAAIRLMGPDLDAAHAACAAAHRPLGAPAPPG